MEFADEIEKIRLLGVISDHEAKWYIRNAAVEKDHEKRDQNLDKAIEALEEAALQFKRIGDDEKCTIKTCEGCTHLFSGLKLFRDGIKEYTESKTNKAFNASLDELEKARKCYEDGENELGKGTVKIIDSSIDLVYNQIRSKEKINFIWIYREFNTIIEELSAVGLRKMVKMYTFDESMKVKKEESEESKIYMPVTVTNSKTGDIVVTAPGGKTHIEKVVQSELPRVPLKSESLTDRLANPASIAGFVGWAGGLVFTIYGYIRSNTYSLIIGIIVFVVLATLKLWKKP